MKGRERRGEGTTKEQGIRKVRGSLRRKKTARNRSMKRKGESQVSFDGYL